MSHRIRRSIGLASLLVLLVHSACERSTTARKPVSAGLETLAAEPFPEAGDGTLSPELVSGGSDTLKSRIAQSALDLNEVFKDRAEEKSAARPVATPSVRAAKSTEAAPPPSAPPESAPSFGLETPTPEDIRPGGETGATVGAPGTDDRKNEKDQAAAALRNVATVAASLADHLRHRTEENRSAISDALVMTTLESLRPGVIAELDKGDSSISQALSREDRRELLAARDRVASDPKARSEARESLAEALRGIAPPTSLQISKAALCTSVRGFGSYEAIGGESFLAMRPLRALVYTELDGFTTREARAGDPGRSGVDPPKYAVELSQSVTLYHDPSGLVAWQRPPQTVVEPCRTKRRDFFLVQRLELPATLSVGKYNLKVRVTDLTSGSEAEAIMPIHVVADPKLVNR